MIRSRFTSAIALAAVLAAAPAFAQTPSSTASGTAQDQHSGTMSSSTQKAATPRNHASQAQRAAADQGRVPLCSELGQPNAGKLANKTTGMAQDNSASAVHMDCLPDGSTAAAATGPTVARNGTVNGSVTGQSSTTAPGSMSNSTQFGARTSNSVTGSTSPSSTNSTTASATGAKTASNNSGR